MEVWQMIVLGVIGAAIAWIIWTGQKSKTGGSTVKDEIGLWHKTQEAMVSRGAMTNEVTEMMTAWRSMIAADQMPIGRDKMPNEPKGSGS